MKRLLLAACLLASPAFGQTFDRGQGAAQTFTPLFSNTTASASIGFTINQDVALTPCTYTIPANTLLKAGDKVRWRAGGTLITGTDTKTVTIRLGNSGVLGADISHGSGATASSTVWRAKGEIIRITTSSQRVLSDGIVSNAGNTSFITGTPTTSVTDTSPQLLVVVAKSNNASPPNDSATCYSLEVEFEAGP